MQLKTEPVVTMDSEPMITVEEESKLETQPTNCLLTLNEINISQENNKNNYQKEEESVNDVDQSTASIPVEKNTIKSKTTKSDVNKRSIESSSPTINAFDGETMLFSGFDLKENHYTYSDEPLELPKKMLDESSDNDDTESIGELSQVSSNLIRCFYSYTLF